ncbi:hypothetical protein ACWOC1_04010 [Enterococcus quebecensis]|uniref:Uncharacterized protein n=1 Tax=Enterococcus quebecensis TaxID=903983 RepID=A0A1E5GY03_9ENTE|nr:hypothetical protein [Enterococcus quebecensis]OEG17200.1 hypothetical protein BCR23_04130 [Enterococcus quebecensis]OJG75592.1 hypothetical protein RV12_GL001395 [Enterococcus quebecensis]
MKVVIKKKQQIADIMNTFYLKKRGFNMNFKNKMKKRASLLLVAAIIILIVSVWAIIELKYFFGAFGILISLIGTLIYSKLITEINSIEE